MTRKPEVYMLGEVRPWPDAVTVVMGVGGRMDYVRERTCRIVKETKTIRSFIHGEVEVTDERCSECKGFMDVCCGVIRNYCPNCGARVER